ncbi:tetratricopeptide repeat protein [Streptomyces sp. TS71-3]|uniref:tetratricopeptide repeat protein n=1 Tax=Streptomyces sp. TS71-3 TaxID=2733862 RepID=UPI0027E353D2|nr:tetratricopeptide repeat protein [Streptomyces sp. TS71-3]
MGPEHPLTLAALTLKARAAHALRRFDEATDILRQLIGRERVLGPEHPFLVENREWLTAWRAEAEADQP